PGCARRTAHPAGVVERAGSGPLRRRPAPPRGIGGGQRGLGAGAFCHHRRRPERFHQRRHGAAGGGQRPPPPLPPAPGGIRRPAPGGGARQPRPQRHPQWLSHGPRQPPEAYRPGGAPPGRGRPLRVERRLPAPQPGSDRLPHLHRARGAPLHQRGDLPRHHRRRGPGGVQWSYPYSPRRPDDQRAPQQPQPAHQQPGGGGHQAGAGDLRRRRTVLPRRHRGPARRGPAPLPAHPGRVRTGGPGAAQLRLHQRDSQPHPPRAAAGLPAPQARRAVRPGPGTCEAPAMTLPSPVKAQGRGFDPVAVRRDFPILAREVNGHPLVYLDNAATTQKPLAMIDAISDYYLNHNANVHRAAHVLSDEATQAFEGARDTVAAFINSPASRQLIWTRGTTESINLVAATWGRANLKAGDRVLVPALEHHSNIVPWQMVAAETGAEVVPIDVTDQGEVDLDALARLLDDRVKLVSLTHVSNALGTVNPVAEVVRLAHAAG